MDTTILEGYDTDTPRVFKLEHNTAEYDRMMRERYELEDYAPARQTAPCVIPVELDTYDAPVRVNNAGSYRPELEEYARPTNRGVAYGAEPAHFETYETPARYDLLKSDVEKNTEKDTIVDEVIAEDIEIESVQDNSPVRLRLNAVGMVAVVSFLAAAVMILSFIIANAVTISGNASAISALSTTNAALTAELNSKIAENATLFETRAEEIATLVKGNPAYVEIPVSQLPQTPAWSPAPNVDASTNLFDWLSRVLSRIF